MSYVCFSQMYTSRNHHARDSLKYEQWPNNEVFTYNMEIWLKYKKLQECIAMQSVITCNLMLKGLMFLFLSRVYWLKSCRSSLFTLSIVSHANCTGATSFSLFSITSNHRKIPGKELDVTSTVRSIQRLCSCKKMVQRKTSRNNLWRLFAFKCYSLWRKPSKNYRLITINIMV